MFNHQADAGNLLYGRSGLPGSCIKIHHCACISDLMAYFIAAVHFGWV
jgi:hypothetical protein